MFYLNLHTLNIKHNRNRFVLSYLNTNKLAGLLILSLLSSYSFANDNYEKALSSFQKNDNKASIVHLKNSLKDNREHVSSRVLLAKNYLALAQGSNAETQLVIAQQDGAGNALLSPLFAQAYLAQKKYERVLQIITPRNNNNQLKSQMFAYRGLAYLGINDLTLANEAFQQSLNLTPTNIDAMLGQAKVELKQEKLAQAIPLIEKALSIYPQNKHALLMAAIAYKNNQQNNKSLNTINRLLTIEPEHLSALLVRSTLLVELKEYNNALNDINIITEEIPNEPVTNYVKVNALNATNAYEKANETQVHLAAIIKNIPKEVMDDQPIYYFIAGLAHFQDGNYGSAENALLTYNKFKNQDIKGLKLLARSQMALGANAQAKKHLMEAYVIDENDHELQSLLGRINILTGNLGKAEYYFNLVIQSRPDSIIAQTDLAKIYLFNNQYYKITKLFSLALTNEQYALSLESEILFILAKAYQETEQYAEAINIVNKLIILEPNNSYAHQIHGSLSGLMNNFSQAKKSYLTAQSLDKNNFQVVIHLARFALAEGKSTEAIALLKQQLTNNDNSALFIELGDAYSKINDEKNASLFYKKAHSFNPSSILSLTKIIDEHVLKNEITEALSVINNHINKYDATPEIYELAATLYFKNNQHTQALYSLEKAVKVSSKKGSSLLKLAKMQLQLTKQELAINSLQRAITWEDDFLPAYILLVGIYTENKAEKEALTLISRLEEVNSNTSITNRLKGDLYWVLGNNVDATKYFKLSINELANKHAILGLYRVYREEQKFKEIEILLSSWLAQNPTDLASSVSLAENYRQKGDIASAQKYYQQLIIQNPTNLVLLNNAAIIAIELEQYKQAAMLINNAFQQDNKNVNIIDTKAWVEVQLGNFNIALPLLREANTLDYQNAEVKYHLAVTLHKLSRQDEALSYLEDAVQSDQTFYDKEKAIILLQEWKTLNNQ